MTVTIPAPYGKADWTDYTDYWREIDAEYLQARSILRYADSGTRNTDLASATSGQTSYLTNPDRLEFKSAVGNWIGVLAAQNLKVSPVNNTGGAGAADESVTISQAASTGGAGLVLAKNLTAINTDTDLNGILKVTGVGAAGFMSLKTGATTVKFTTDATGLALDKGVTAPASTFASLIVTGALGVGSLVATGAISGATVTATSGGAITGGSVGTTTGNIGGVIIGANKVTASAGFFDEGGKFSGTASTAKMNYWSGSADGAAYVEVSSANVHLLATGDFAIEGQTKVFESKGIIYYNGASYAVPGSVLGYGGPVVYSTTALTAANYPPGTIWVS